jgi:hypothetical protein
MPDTIDCFVINETIYKQTEVIPATETGFGY